MQFNLDVPRGFELGEVRVAQNVLDAVGEATVYRGLIEHVQTHWGQVTPKQWRINDYALENGGGALVSEYTARNAGVKITIITDGDRKHTSVVLTQDFSTDNFR